MEYSLQSYQEEREKIEKELQIERQKPNPSQSRIDELREKLLFVVNWLKDRR